MGTLSRVNSGTSVQSLGYFTILRSQWAFEIRSLTGPCDTRNALALIDRHLLWLPKRTKGVYGSGLGSSRLAHSARRSYFSSLTPLLTVVDIPSGTFSMGGGVEKLCSQVYKGWRRPDARQIKQSSDEKSSNSKQTPVEYTPEDFLHRPFIQKTIITVRGITSGTYTAFYFTSKLKIC